MPIPSVPFRTPMRDERGNLTRPWILFFEQQGGAFLPPGFDGGVNAQTADYAAVRDDNSKILTFASASPVTLTLPATPPGDTWNVFVQNTGAGAVTVDPNGRNLDGSGSSVALSTGEGVYISTDGTDYFTERGMGGGGSTITLETNGTPNGLQTLLNLIAAANVTITDDGTGGIHFSIVPPVTLSAAISAAILTLTQSATTGSGAALVATSSTPTGTTITVTSTGTLGNGVDSTQTGSGAAIKGTATNGVGVVGLATGILATGVQAQATGAVGTALLAQAAGGAAGAFSNNSAGTATITAANSGAGAAFQFTGYMQSSGVHFAALPTVIDGSLMYCDNAKNILDDGAAAGSVAVTGGHGSMLVRLNGSWRVMC